MNSKLNNRLHDLAFIALGSNLSFGDMAPWEILSNAIKRIAQNYQIIAVSSKYISPPWPAGSIAPDYLNMVIAINGARSPFAMMRNLLKIEKDFGRIRDLENRNAPRTLDLDIVDFRGIVMDETQNDISLCLPHPRLELRDFVLLPLAEIAPDWKHPQTGKEIAQISKEFITQNQQFTAKML